MPDDLQPTWPELTFPEEEKALVKNVYSRAERILEYGSGGSTAFAAEQTKARVLSVESDKDWTQRLEERLSTPQEVADRVTMHWVNVGPTGKWGYPTDSSRWKHYHKYALDPWTQFDFRPDVVLIDGRFRLACLAATMLNCQAPTTVLYDDFVNRSAYQRALELLTPIETVGRMVRFEVLPELRQTLNPTQLIPWFFSVK